MMELRIASRHLDGVLVLAPDVVEKDRGFAMQTYHQRCFEQLGLGASFVQEEHARHAQGTLRGLRLYVEPGMGTLVRVSAGSAFVVAVDARRDSYTQSLWFGMEISAANRKQVWIPEGYAWGFCVLSEFAELQTKTTDYTGGRRAAVIRWDDPEIDIRWPLRNPRLAARERNAPTLQEWLAAREAAVAAPAESE